MTALTLRRPDDLHLHLRDGEAMRSVLPFTAARFARALIMPNLRPPVTTTEHAQAYRQRILDALPAGTTFAPLMIRPRSTVRRRAAASWASSSTRRAQRPIPMPG
jgi:dihydroorotase